MGWRNPPIPWSELERRYAGRPPVTPLGADSGDSPAWSRKRSAYEAPPDLQPGDRGVPYAELHCHSNFSFLVGASHPEELAAEAVRLGLDALALTDRDGLYGIVRFAEAAREVSLRTIFGAELTVSRTNDRLVVLARNPDGYARLSCAIAEAHLAGGEKGNPRTSLAQLADAHGGQWQVLTGGREGAVVRALLERGPNAAARELGALVDAFGRDRVGVELWDHGDPLDSARNDALVKLAVQEGVDVVATNDVHYATPGRHALATALAAVRRRESLDEADGWLPAAATRHLRSGAEQGRRFARYPGVVERAAALGLECAFDLSLVAPNLPPFPCPPGLDEMGYLRVLVERGGTERYGARGGERVPGAWAQIDHELRVIEELGFPGYFLVVWDIVEFCRRVDILCQGRGSAANSAVCFALGVTSADAVSLGLLFERFLSPERDGPPDIDIDIESGRREEVIQYVYAKHGRRNAAQVANVITYRASSAVRDMGKALGHAQGQVDAWSKQLDFYASVNGQTDRAIPDEVLALAAEVEHFPRHLGIHSGGMVMCDRPVVEVCPVEWGRMKDRTVLQWDKDDCAAAGLVKFDLLGLGMLSMLHGALDLLREHEGLDLTLATIPNEDPAVYEMLSRADSVGVFQVESRAQMATLPRLKPRTFYDLVVEVALIRPGPIQGGSVHPYIRRRNGLEEVTYLHPLLENSLGKTLGVPLFQEQLMQMAIDVAGFTAGEADQLRQAMGSKRSRERMERLRARLYEGMAANGITAEVADAIYEKLAAFANFGFPESHSVSFAYLVYASAWFKCHHPAVFCAALLNAQPMGFWSPDTIVRDARRHGVTVRRADVNRSDWCTTLEDLGAPSRARRGSLHRERGSRELAVRLGIQEVRAVGDDLAKRIAAGRPYRDLEDVVRRAEVPLPAMEALATAGAFRSLGHDRRSALWAAGATAQAKPDRLPGVVTGVHAPPLPGMSPAEETVADLWSTGIAVEHHPVEHVRDHLRDLGVLTAVDLHTAPLDERVLTAGVVTHRQRPATASGTVFLNLEDETGLINVICSQGVWTRFRSVAASAPALLVRGTLERVDGVVNVVADRIEPLPVSTSSTRARNFR
jgi:error-prone DNA polymerase